MLSEYGKDKWQKDGLTYACKPCRRKAQKEYNDKHPEIRQKILKKNRDWRRQYWKRPENTAKLRDQHLKQNYGITLKEYDEMFDKQNGVCGICKRPERTEKNKNLCVDHCHETGKIRELLCSHCNRALGLLNENKDFFLNAVAYLEKHK